MQAISRFCRAVVFGCLSIVLIQGVAHAQSSVLWEVGMDDNGWPAGTGGGPNTSFLQENGVINALPGDAFTLDNDYYFSGLYETLIPGNGDYFPVGLVTDNEESAERAFAGGDNDLRYHFNLPDTLKPTNFLSVTFDIFNLHEGQTDSRYGIEVWVNGVKVQNEILVRPAQINVDFTTPQFTLESVGAQVGPGFDNIVSLRGINYNNDGGGNWMGLDYVRMNLETERIPEAVFPWQVGKDDNANTAGDGGGTNATFVAQNETTNPLPGVANSPETDGNADNDYYLAGAYSTAIAANGDYTPVGTVEVNEEGVERGLTAGNTELRFHFNLPNTIKPGDLMSITVDPLALDTSVASPQYGIEIYFNNVRLGTERIIGPGQLNTAITTASFTAQSVGAQVGPGFDNIIMIKGINKAGGGAFVTFDYVRLNSVLPPIPAPTLPWSVGNNDNLQPVNLSGGGVNTAFVQENGVQNALPGVANSPKTDQAADNDYYLAGMYTNVITGNGAYTPIGPVVVNEEAAERAFVPGDTEQRYHFNLPANISPTNLLAIQFDAFSIDSRPEVPDPRWGVEVYVNNVLVLPEVIITPTELNTHFETAPFTVASVNAQAGPGWDNIVTLKGIPKTDGGNWLGIDYVELSPVVPPAFPWVIGKDDNGHAAGLGGGVNATFVQEAGINLLPGTPYSPKRDANADDDYYLAGEYTRAIQSVIDLYGDYTPFGTVLLNEEGAERAFGSLDNEKRYHFNIPAGTSLTNEFVVTSDFLDLDGSGGNAQYGFEVYVNGVKVQDEIIVTGTPSLLDHDFVTAPFTLASVNADVGPGGDNIVTLKGINHAADGGGNWMGIDYVAFSPVPTSPIFPIQIGRDDNTHAAGDGGGINATFVQEAGINPLPGNPSNRELNQQADDDYYLAGVYSNVISSVVDLYGDYTPLGIVPFNEEAAERAFAGTDNEKRYHFNLPSTLKPTNLISVTFDPLDLNTGGDDPRYGVEVYFNGILVGPEVIVRTNMFDTDISTPGFTLASVNAAVGPGYDNVVTLKGINYNGVGDGAGNWMGIDYVKIAEVAAEELKFNPITLSNGQITISWVGAGVLESATSVTGPWNPVTPAPTNPFSVTVVPTQNLFYRLKQGP